MPCAWQPSTRQLMVRDRAAYLCGLTPEQLLSREKPRRIAWRRQQATWLIVEALPALTWPNLGKLLDRDHSSVIYTPQRVEARRATEPGLAITLEWRLAKLRAFAANPNTALPQAEARRISELRRIRRACTDQLTRSAEQRFRDHRYGEFFKGDVPADPVLLAIAEDLASEPLPEFAR